MKTKTQKQEELKKGKELLSESKFLVFADLTKIRAEDLRRLRRELNNIGSSFLVIKKRLLNLLLKEKKISYDVREFKSSVGTVFTPEIEKSAGSLLKFFKGLGVEKENILGGYDVHADNVIKGERVRMIGALPPREVLLGQLLGMIAAPIRSLLYVLKEKSQRSG